MSHYDAGVPSTLAPYPDRTLLDYLADLARDAIHQPALLFKGATMSWRALEQLSDACASAFHALGVRRGDRVALLLPNCPQFSIAQFGAWKLGAIVAPLNPTYTEHELEGPLRENGVETIVTLTRFYDRVKHVQPRTPLRRVIATNIKEYFPPALRLLFTLAAREAGRRPRSRSPRATTTSRTCCWSIAADVRRARRSCRGDPAVLLMSGGTTGTPKGVVGTHGAYVISGMQLRIWNAAAHGADPSKDVMFVPLPLFHVYANVGSQSFAILHGAPVALVPNPRDLADLLATIRRVKPAFFNGVPTLYIALLNHPDVQQRQSRLQVDQGVLLRRRSAPGRHQTAFRSVDRRARRRRVFADRSDDGGLRKPGDGREQSRIRRDSAARRAACASSTTRTARVSCLRMKSGKSRSPAGS